MSVIPRLTQRLWADALLCRFIAPRLARWTVVVIDRHDGTEYPVNSVALRWHSSAMNWIAHHTAKWKVDMQTDVMFAARRLR